MLESPVPFKHDDPPLPEDYAEIYDALKELNSTIDSAESLLTPAFMDNDDATPDD